MRLLEYENKIWSSGIDYIAGVDEAGRGPLAGPLVVASVILDKNHLYNRLYSESSISRNNDVSSEILAEYTHINDSKKMRPNARKKLFEFITLNALCYSIVVIDTDEIDKSGVGMANSSGFAKAINEMGISPQYVITDYFKLNMADYHNKQLNLTKGDSLSLSVAAASILAKVYRDNLMQKTHQEFPQYGFNRHKGYGTKLHKQMIQKYGRCSAHRTSFKIKGID